uniref:Uncharacterized protein n=1 Tax=Ditylenchus dipsaci TaxID=166011 RepID=A0A915CT32_9BILA
MHRCCLPVAIVFSRQAFALSSLLYTQHLPKHCSNKKPVPFDFCDDGNILWTFIPDGKNVAIKKIDRQGEPVAQMSTC